MPLEPLPEPAFSTPVSGITPVSVRSHLKGELGLGGGRSGISRTGPARAPVRPSPGASRAARTRRPAVSSAPGSALSPPRCAVGSRRSRYQESHPNVGVPISHRIGLRAGRSRGGRCDEPAGFYFLSIRTHGDEDQVGRHDLRVTILHSRGRGLRALRNRRQRKHRTGYFGGSPQVSADL